MPHKIRLPRRRNNNDVAYWPLSLLTVNKLHVRLTDSATNSVTNWAMDSCTKEGTKIWLYELLIASEMLIRKL